MASDPAEHDGNRPVEGDAWSRGGLGLWVVACAALGVPLAWAAAAVAWYYAPVLLLPLATGAVAGACLVGAMRVCADAPSRDRHARRGPREPGRRLRPARSRLSPRLRRIDEEAATYHRARGDLRQGRPGRPPGPAGRTPRLPPPRGRPRTRTGHRPGNLHRPRRARLAELGRRRRLGRRRGSRRRATRRKTLEVREESWGQRVPRRPPPSPQPSPGGERGIMRSLHPQSPIPNSQFPTPAQPCPTSSGSEPTLPSACGSPK